MTVHLSYQEWDGDGSTKEFTFTFDYLNKSHVFCYLNNSKLKLVADGEPADGEWAWDGDKKVKLGTAPEKGEVFKVERDTPDDKQIVEWEDGSYLVSNDLNTSDLQWLYLIQELNEGSGSDGGGIVKSLVGTLPVKIDSSTPAKPVVSLDLITGDQAAKDPSDPSWDTDTKVLTPAAAMRLFGTVIGDGKSYPGDGNKGLDGKIRIDDSDEVNKKIYYWKDSEFGWEIIDLPANVVIQDKAPKKGDLEAGTLWFNSTDGRLYILYNDDWADASPEGTFVVNLGYTAETDGGTVTNDKGDDAKLTLSTEEKAGLMSPAQFKKLKGINDGGEENVQSDWGQTDSEKDDFIKNKPTISENEDGDITNVRVNLSRTVSEETVTINNDKGDDTTIPTATDEKAGVMSAEDHKKLSAVGDGTDLGEKDRGTTTLTITSSTGDDYVVPAATQELCGLMSAGDKERLANTGRVLLFQGLVDLSSSETESPTEDGDVGFTWINDNGEKEGAQECSAEWAAKIRNMSEGDAVGAGDFVIWTEQNDFVHLANVMIPTNLTVDNVTATTLDVASSTGGDATIPAATDTKAGLLTGALRKKLNELENKTNLKWVGKGKDSAVIESDTGDDATLPKVTSSQAGLMSGTEHDKLKGLTAGATKSDLGYTKAKDQGTVTNTGGTAATLPLADGTNAGLLKPSHYTRIDGVEDGAEKNVQSDWNNTVTTADAYIKNKPTITIEDDKVTNIAFDLSVTTNTNNVRITNPCGNDATIPAATDTRAGVMTDDDRKKLDSLSAYVLPTASTTVKGGIKVGSMLTMVGGGDEVMNVYHRSTNVAESVVSRDASGNFAAQDVQFSKLEVTSTSKFGNKIEGTSIEMSGNICAFSDEVLKNIKGYVVPAAHARIWAYKYTLKADKEEKPQIGFIAQEVQKVYPEAVHTNDEGLLMLDYGKMVVPLWAQVQELQRKVDELTEKLEALS
ncbi:tail fiber protein [uncultured phage_MedDCM-OCT-S38-C3]|uniref:Phage related tail fibre protein n=1 Tax=uncultured phage_MedDCM-OCT-S38-C3 TaxID=2740803 RepID=A0A6S4P7W9_9CAUD|nr:tail fiber protein [uncultured phage_MedDCM-OCT-S38-C3]BAQ94451.1 phage related tail fibre protein [uncultured phage_MedDCM-OCT-S38-C3]